MYALAFTSSMSVLLPIKYEPKTKGAQQVNSILRMFHISKLCCSMLFLAIKQNIQGIVFTVRPVIDCFVSCNGLCA